MNSLGLELLLSSFLSRPDQFQSDKTKHEKEEKQTARMCRNDAQYGYLFVFPHLPWGLG